MSGPTPQWTLRSIAKRLESLAAETVNPVHSEAIRAHADSLVLLAEEVTPEDNPQALTPQQARVLDFIRQRIANRGEAPTRKEIGTAFSFASPNAAQEHLRALERKGLLTLTGETRGIRLRPPTLIEGTP